MIISLSYGTRGIGISPSQYTDPVPGVGQVEELVPEAAPVAHQEIFRGQAWALLCLDGTLHSGTGYQDIFN